MSTQSISHFYVVYQELIIFQRFASAKHVLDSSLGIRLPDSSAGKERRAMQETPDSISVRRSAGEGIAPTVVFCLRIYGLLSMGSQRIVFGRLSPFHFGNQGLRNVPQEHAWQMAPLTIRDEGTDICGFSVWAQW